MNTVLLTGGTGFLGTEITNHLLQQPETTILLLIRAESEDQALNRLHRAWWEMPDLRTQIGSRIQILRGDITDPRLADPDYAESLKQVTHIIHVAADIRLTVPLEALRATNVKGTENLLRLAERLHDNHHLTRFSYISTAYVAGRRTGIIPEDTPTADQGFRSNYEQSKYEAELLVRESKVPWTIFRPGMIVGDSKTGYIKTFNTIYVPLRLYLTGRLPRILPVRPSLRVNLIPVDEVADAISTLTFQPDTTHLTFHLTAPYETLPTIQELARYVSSWAQQHLHQNPSTPIFMALPESLVSTFLKRNHSENALSTLSPYFFENRQYQRQNTDRYRGQYQKRWQDYLPHLLDYAVYNGFLHRSERTVPEQIIYRLQSTTRPVTYHDIRGEQTEKQDSAKVRCVIMNAAKALQSMGLEKGDRVAVVGLNSTRYLIIDTAIGLIGAVTVPLYYTSPPSEIHTICKQSGSRLLFLGVPALLDHAEELAGDISVISFCRQSPGSGRKTMAWEDFLARGTATQQLRPALIDFDDIATLRYTSGTTGQPKGVIFTHRQTRWMAESLASLPPWKNRNETVVYLSFLPMNHVVEGILGLYSPYYAPAPLNIYFLEDFRNLPEGLRKVRPVIFFSVPRFYEKLWETIEKTGLGRRYLQSKEGIKKKMLRSILKYFVLKRSGLDRCSQLIVGSAPVSSELLAKFHQLGIEVHNAYGLTEAPLITMNRLGSNEIGTVGTPLPETNVRISDDGEILVRGPQVTVGYYEKDIPSPVVDGWLHTGDVGCITKTGAVVIECRKKELVKTSYGKLIAPQKIEMLLRDIPGVKEALVVGEGRPYIAAFLWVDDVSKPSSDIEAGVRSVNSRLSHAEQVKRWMVLPYRFSVESGDLTANYKLKRSRVLAQHQQDIDDLYGGKAYTVSGICIGGEAS